MSKSAPKKARAEKPAPQPPDKPPHRPRRPQVPAWRGRIGLIVMFFGITLGSLFLYSFWGAISNWIYGSSVTTYDFRVVAKYPHDSEAFTEGLIYLDGKLFESTGMEGRSSLRKIDLEKKQIDKKVDLDPKLFGEGLTLWRDRLIQLTYNSGLALTYDLELARQDQTFNYEGQGWGLTHDGQSLIMSNGTSELQFRDPATFELDHRLPVTMAGRRLGRLNELEFVDGKIYANVWHEDYIYEIDPETGFVTSRIDLRSLLPRDQRPNHPEAVLNGIAYNTDTKRFIVTGKFWPWLFEIELVPRQPK